MASSAACTQCGLEDESVVHLLRHCPVAKRIWREVIQPHDLSKFEAISDVDWIRINLQEHFVSKLNPDFAWPAVFAAAIWNIWKSRNVAVFRGKAESLPRLLFLINQLGSDLNLRLNPNSSYQNSLKWKKPKLTWTKLNVDGSCIPQDNSGAIGGLLRDEDGKWLWGFSSPLHNPIVNETELHSVLRGLTLAWDRRILKLQVETDSVAIFNWLTETDSPPIELEPLVLRCKELLRKHWDINLQKIDRRANSCADHLASLGYNYGGEKLWFDLPISIIPALGFDIDS